MELLPVVKNFFLYPTFVTFSPFLKSNQLFFFSSFLDIFSPRPGSVNKPRLCSFHFQKQIPKTRFQSIQFIHISRIESIEHFP